MPWFDYVEWFLGMLFYPSKGYDSQLFTKAPFFKSLPQNITVDAPGLNGKLKKEHANWGAGRLPQLKWSMSGLDAKNVEEYILIVEDPDAPLGTSTHGIYCGIPSSRTSIRPEDIDLVRTEKDKKHIVKSGITVAKNELSTVYIPPSPPLGHGMHRYYFEIIALNDALDPKEMSAVPSKKELKKLIQGRVAGWGQWVGLLEATWDRNQ